MAPQAATTAQTEPQPTLTKYELTPDKANYIVNRSELEELLKNTFGAGVDFHVSTKSGRWIYHAERELTTKEVRKWIAELDKRKKAKAQARANGGGGGGPESSGESGGE